MAERGRALVAVGGGGPHDTRANSTGSFVYMHSLHISIIKLRLMLQSVGPLRCRRDASTERSSHQC